LTASTLYYFRFQATNSIGTTTSGELSFTTSSSVGNPSNVIGIPTSVSVLLSWTLGTGDTGFMVRVGYSTYPTTTTDGVLVYEGSSTTTTHTGLTPGAVYYYSVWGESGGAFSSSYATCIVTTNAGSIATTSTGAQLTTPWRWLSAPNYSNLSNLPVVYDAVNNAADAIQMPRASLWMVFALISTAFVGILAYSGAGLTGRGQQSQAIGMIGGLVMLTLWWAVQIVPWYILLLYVLWLLSMFRAKRELD